MSSTAIQTLMGVEVEWSVYGRSLASPFARIPLQQAYDLLIEEFLRQEPCLGDAQRRGGYFMRTGGLIYNEIHNHPETATPECTDPATLAAYEKAFERRLTAVANAVRVKNQIDLRVSKRNLGAVFGDAITFASHDSYLSAVSPKALEKPLAAHLASRTLYAGAGCLSAHAEHGFELSQRARHISCVIGGDTQTRRPMICTRVLAERGIDRNKFGHRVHLITKDSLRAPFGAYLTAGTTMLLIAMHGGGRTLNDPPQLVDPVAALQAISRDPYLRGTVATYNRGPMTAIDLQLYYLEQAERFVHDGRDVPTWAPQLARHWRETLEQLAADPLRLANRLDSYCKLALLERQLSRTGCSAAELHQAIECIDRFRTQYGDPVIAELLERHERPPTGIDPVKLAAARADWAGLGREQQSRIGLALRLRVLLDVNFHELGGFYDQLELEGRIEPVVIGEADIDRAMTQPPPGTRAEARGRFVAEHAPDSRYAAHWVSLVDRERGVTWDIRNPFERHPKEISTRDFRTTSREFIEMETPPV